MANIGDPFSTSIPAVGSAGPAFATDINAILTEVMSRLSSRIPLSSLLNNADFDLNGQNLLNAAYLGLINGASTPSSSPANRLTAYSGNLYWVGASGSVQITSGSGLNSAAIGGINGDYGGVNVASVYMDAATTRYNFYTDFSAGTWAYLRGLGFDIAGSTTSTKRARLAWGGTSDMTITLPAAVPTGQKLLQMDSAGAVTASSTLASGEHITLVGTGDLKHGDKTYCWPFYPNGYYTSAGAPTFGLLSNELQLNLLTGDTISVPLGAPKVGDRVKSLQIFETSVGTAPTYTVYINGASQAYVRTVAATNFVTLTLNTPFTIASPNPTFSPTITLKIQAGSVSNQLNKGVFITYDRP
jgi:hypothetical protein